MGIRKEVSKSNALKDEKFLNQRYEKKIQIYSEIEWMTT